MFNFPVALKSMIDMLEIDGHVLIMTPAKNFMGHGFYQFSPEIYYNFLGRNGFEQIDAYGRALISVLLGRLDLAADADQTQRDVISAVPD